MIGQTISQYKIIEKLGEGGMGVVYKAQDTKLDRFVALKFLPSHLSASEQDKLRFIQEAKAASALNHPNVCTIHDIQEQESQMFIVMEYVDGRTLRDRKETLSVKQTIDIGIQMADGLAAAHEKGIVHRDIKPENIMIRKDGIVQIMDFGLAKLRGVSRLTKEGSTVGTAGYMSPEQVQGLDSDHRSDIFSLGVVLYELFTGELPFKGVHETAFMYEIVNVDPAPMSAMKPEIDPALDAIILECLAKEQAERYQSVAEVSKELRRFKRESSKQRVSRVTVVCPAYQPPDSVRPESISKTSVVEKTMSRFRKDPLGWSMAGLFLFSSLVLSLAYFIRPSSENYMIRSNILPPEKANFYFYGGEAGPVVISPDGKQLTFVAVNSEGKRFLYVQRMADQRAQLLTGTENASYPFWSPDNQFIGFFSDGKLKKVEASGSPPFTICVAGNARGGTWNQDGTILFSPDAQDGIYRVTAEGGSITQITRLDSSRKEQTHRWPYVLPDGNHFFYYARTAVTGSEKENDAIYIASMDLKVNKILVNASSNMAYASGSLLFMRGSTLVAQKLDDKSLELKGEVIPIAEGVLNDAGFNLAVFSVSKNGVLVYQTGFALAGSRLILYDRTGKPLRTVGEVTEYFTPHLSPDGKKIAVGTFDAKSRNQDIWVYDIDRSIRTRFTFDQAVEFDPIWSPDGKMIVFNSFRKGSRDLYEKPSSEDRTEKPLFESVEDEVPTDWSSDGKWIAFTRVGADTRADIWVLPYIPEKDRKDQKPFPFLQTEFREFDAHFSPDGKWIAYQSDESGESEVYLRPFPGPGGKWQISTDGGHRPRWRRDGKELYYINRNTIIATEIQSQGSSVTVGTEKPLFETRPILDGSVYDVTSDGSKFLINTQIDPESSAPISLVVNWDRGLEKK